MIELITTLGLLWIAWVIVVYLHEMGHGGKRIKIIWGLIPQGASIEARWKLGGLTINILLAYLVFKYNPRLILFQYVGLLAWAHFILYMILGSFNREIPRKKLIILNFLYPKKMSKFFKTYIFDDVPNELWFIFVPLGIIVFWWMKDFYLPMFGMIWNQILIGFGG